MNKPKSILDRDFFNVNENQGHAGRVNPGRRMRRVGAMSAFSRFAVYASLLARIGRWSRRPGRRNRPGLERRVRKKINQSTGRMARDVQRTAVAGRALLVDRISILHARPFPRGGVQVDGELRRGSVRPQPKRAVPGFRRAIDGGRNSYLDWYPNGQQMSKTKPGHPSGQIELPG